MLLIKLSRYEFRRFIRYLFGMLILALGSVVAIKSGLGVSPITSLPFGITNVTNISIGTASAILYSSYVGIQFVILKRDFKKLQLLQIVFAILFGSIVNFFNGINEGKTKFIKKTIRGGQSVDYPGNIIIIGDINSGAEVSAGGNIIVLGSIKGHVRAGIGGNKKSIIAAFFMQPELMQISDVLTISPDDGLKPSYPEVAKIKDGYIVVEPYLPNKYIY